MRYVALLRGINVGGRNMISKDELRQLFEDMGFERVRTYIQSGNILFRGNESDSGRLAIKIEKGLSTRFSYPARAVAMSSRQYSSAVASAPDDWGKSDRRKHNALFTLGGVTAQEVLDQLPAPKKRIETVTTGPGVLFWSASKKHLTKTTMLKLSSAPVYQQVTIRNHNTVFKLLSLFDAI